MSYRTLNGEEGWAPVVRKKRIKKRTSTSSESESDKSGSKIDVSCFRLVEYEKREGPPGLMVYCRGPATWTLIIISAKRGPIGSRTQSKAVKTCYCMCPRGSWIFSLESFPLHKIRLISGFFSERETPSVNFQGVGNLLLLIGKLIPREWGYKSNLDVTVSVSIGLRT